MNTLTSKVIGLPFLRALAALFAAALLGACGGGTPVLPKIIEVTPVEMSGTRVEATVGDTIIVSLKANPSTGYAWKFTAGNTFEIVSSTYVSDPTTGPVTGAGGKQVLTLKVTKAGSSELTGNYGAPWMVPAPGAIPDFSMTVLANQG
jgi:predicted secreted protein